jgi:transcriptional regulator with XRE-family HTH domain
MDEHEFAREMSNLLFFHRKSKKITLEKLSELTGIDNKFLNLLERGKHSTLLPSYFKIAKILDVPINDISEVINKYFKQ